MQKQVKVKLKEKASEAAERFSNPERSKNYNSETFEVHNINPLSEYTACVVMKKNTGKYGAFFFYYINSGEGYWNYFVPTDSHILGMESFRKYKDSVESHNFTFK